VTEAPVTAKSILVVEDTEKHRKLFQALLDPCYTVTLAVDRESAELQLRGGKSFDLLILDSKIPAHQGDDDPVRSESFSFLKEFRKYSSSPVIMVVSHEIDLSLRSEAAKFQVSDILEKPVLSTDLEESVARLLRDRSARRSK
jgi:DNA-binding NtrC family response regulator